MDTAGAQLLQAWEAGTPFQAPIPTWLHSFLAIVTLGNGLALATKFGVSQKQSIHHDLSTAIPSALLLGAGLVFLFLSVGLYI
ncbi:hypothetical protein BGZ73_008720 [Actinomortierella ambigua]|nr:hypothetical protein BGZ73_008720 [Actinomortierella ambigua]